MIHAEVAITDPYGVHARVAQELAGLADQYASSLFLRRAGDTVSLRSPIQILSLDARPGDVVSVWADGADEQEALDAVVKRLGAFTPPFPTPLSEAPGETTSSEGLS